MTTPNDAEKAAEEFALLPEHQAELPVFHRLTLHQIAIRHGFLAGAAWQAERMRAVVEAAKEMRDLLHLRLRYCPEALWLEENYIKLKDALAALERGGDK